MENEVGRGEEDKGNHSARIFILLRNLLTSFHLGVSSRKAI